VNETHKGMILNTLKSKEVTVEFEVLTRGKDNAENIQTCKQIVQMIQDLKIGVVSKEQPAGKLVNEWNTAIEGANLNTVDISAALATLLAPKDSVEVQNIKTASLITARTMTSYVAPYITSLIDNGKKQTHEKISESIESVLNDERKKARLKIDSPVNWKLVEWCYPPIVQSGGKYDLKPSAVSDGSNIHAGTVIVGFGTRYRSYCSNLGRTILINPEKVFFNSFSKKKRIMSFCSMFKNMYFPLFVGE
jgi:nucleosome binding factor SPN SPT16 subunit